MADIAVKPNDRIKCERARITARYIDKKKKPVPSTSKDKAQLAIANVTVRIKVEKLYRRTGKIPLE